MVWDIPTPHRWGEVGGEEAGGGGAGAEEGGAA